MDFPSPAEFRQHLVIEADSVKRPLCEVLDPWQRHDFEALDQAWLRVAGHGTGGVEGAWLERPRGHSKTSDLAVQVAWVLAFANRQISGVAAASDKDQAKLLRDAISRLTQSNAWLAEYLECQEYKIIGRATGSVLEIISADVASSWGRTPHFIIADEATHWQKRDLWDSLTSSAAKRGDSLLMVITNAGFKPSWQWDAREIIRQDEDWYFRSLHGAQASWIKPKALAKQRALLPPSSYQRLWLNEWIDGAGDALDPGDVSAAIRHDLGELQRPEDGWIYVAGGDLGVTRDASAVVVLGVHVGSYTEAERQDDTRAIPEHLRILADLDEIELPAPEVDEVYVPGTGRIRLAAVRIWKPPAGGRVSLEDVEREIAVLAERFNLASIGLDPHQAAQMIERLGRRGLPARAAHQVPGTLQEQATAVLAAFRERRIDLYPHADLIADLKALRVVEKQYGFRLSAAYQNSSDQPGTRHADSASALSIALALAGRAGGTRIISTVDDFIVA